jgi:hypothetical protein
MLAFTQISCKLRTLLCDNRYSTWPTKENFTFTSEHVLESVDVNWNWR